MFGTFAYNLGTGEIIKQVLIRKFKGLFVLINVGKNMATLFNILQYSPNPSIDENSTACLPCWTANRGYIYHFSWFESIFCLAVWANVWLFCWNHRYNYSLYHCCLSSLVNTNFCRWCRITVVLTDCSVINVDKWWRTSAEKCLTRNLHLG